MKTTDLIKIRKSIRNFKEEPISDELIAKITDYAGTLQPRFGGEVRIDVVKQNFGSEPIKLGTYGMIKNGSVFLVLIYKDAPKASLSAAYLFEQVILYCTELGLGTCWMAAFNKGDFEKLVSLNKNETLSNISPVGNIEEKPRFITTLARKIVKADARKPFENLFFHNDFLHPLSPANAKNYQTPLEMLRLSPSASNKQPWRVVVNDDILHFYKTSNSKSLDIDMGIALCHFELTCKELNIDGDFEVYKEHPASPQYEYVIS